MPSGLTFATADSPGLANAATVTWHGDLGATAPATLHTTMSVSSTPKSAFGWQRWPVPAWPHRAAHGWRVHSDLLPAGRQAAARQAAQGSGVAASSPSRNWYIGGRWSSADWQG
jgi:hypothetical protein